MFIFCSFYCCIIYTVPQIFDFLNGNIFFGNKCIYKIPYRLRDILYVGCCLSKIRSSVGGLTARYMDGGGGGVESNKNNGNGKAKCAHFF